MSIEHYCFCDLAPLYALDLLTEVERLWVEDQIEQGPELAAELLELQAAVAALAHTAPIAPLTPQLKDRLQQTLGLVGVPVALVEGQRRRRFPTRRVLAWGGGAIAAGLVVALAWENRQLHQVTQAMQQQIVTLQQKTEETQQQIAILEQLDTVIYPLKGTENAPLSQGRLIVNPTQQTAVIMTQQLPELPTGQAYRLWAMPVGATQPLYCGQFQRHPTESATRWTLPASACSHNVAQMLISAESTSAPLQPAGPLMMKSLI